jgi:hypothetical protein
VVPAIAGALSAVASWQRWIQPFVDGSREMQVPARVAAGERLYGDVVYYYGPAAPWINGAALRVFGRNWGVLELVGGLAGAGLLAALYRLTRRAASPLAAGGAVTLAAALCFGAPNGGSFLFPYAFASLFAIAGGFAALAALAETGGARLSGRNAAAAAGLALALLAKPEIGAAAAAALALAAVRAESWKAEARRTGLVLISGGLAAALGYAVAFRGISLAALRSEGPLVLFSPPAEWQGVYRLISGFADPAASLSQIATALFLDLVILGAAFAASRSGVEDAARPAVAEIAWYAALALAVLLLATGTGSRIEDRLPPLLAPMPLVAAAAALLLLRVRLDAVARARFLLFAFSALIASRVVLGVAYGYRTTPYSILALPGLAACAAVLTIDGLARRAARPLAWRRAAAGVFFAVAAVGLLRLHRANPPDASAPVATAAGTLRVAPPVAGAMIRTLEFLAARARPGDTLSGLPEAGIFNFVTGISNPLGEEQILPGHLDPSAEARVVERLRTAGPRFVVLVDLPPPGWQAARFGADYARGIAAEIDARYDLAERVDGSGGFPSRSGASFIRIYERRAPTP